MRVGGSGGNRIPADVSVADVPSFARVPTLATALASRTAGEVRSLFGGLSVSRIAALPRALWAPIVAGYLGRSVGPTRTPVSSWAALQGSHGVGTPADTKAPHALAEEISAMNRAWPRGHEGDDPAAFLAAAGSLEGYRTSRLEALGREPRPDHLRALMREADAMHGKPAQTEHLVAAALDLFAHHGEALARVDGWREDDVTLALSAAPWLNLADLETPVAVLAAHRKVTDDEFVRYIKPRFAKNAELVQRFGLGDDALVDFFAKYRGPDQRLGAAALDLVEGAVAMGSKPFFRTERGIDFDKLEGALRGNAERARVPVALVDVVVTWIREGGVDRTVRAARATDLFVRT